MADCEYGKEAYNEVERVARSYYADPGVTIEAYCGKCSRCFYLDRKGRIKTIGVCPENIDNGLREAEMVANNIPSIFSRFQK